MKRVHAMVSGDVQGVGYRYTLQHVARQAGVTGWVRNLRDGRVEAELEGEGAAVDTALAWMRAGPSGGRVGAVETEQIAPLGGTGFEIRRDA